MFVAKENNRDYINKMSNLNLLMSRNYSLYQCDGMDGVEF